jgi:hypothetical protein
MKLLMECRNVTQEVLLLIGSFVQNAKQHASLYFLFSGLKIMDHGNLDSNLESLYILVYSDCHSSRTGVDGCTSIAMRKSQKLSVHSEVLTDRYLSDLISEKNTA